MLLLTACRSGEDPAGLGPGRSLRIATTTSLEASGLLDVLLPAFQRHSGISVHAVVVGTGQALKFAESGDCDAVLVHDREGEERLLSAGVLIERRMFARNDFVVVGPPEDPAGVRQSPSIIEAFRRVAEKGAFFISRGDDSGTHRAERRLWEKCGIRPAEAWYLSAGQGMIETLLMADEKRGYALSDRSTFLRAKKRFELEILHQGGREVRNEYAILLVNPARHPHARHREAHQLLEFLLSPEGQRLIGSVTAAGTRLFEPAVGEAP
ncbi:MAG: solute-binding protein [Myxococcales bacterium]|nr:solute-binding protein [Myxococcales bacterium]